MRLPRSWFLRGSYPFGRRERSNEPRSESGGISIGHTASMVDNGNSLATAEFGWRPEKQEKIMVEETEITNACRISLTVFERGRANFFLRGQKIPGRPFPLVRPVGWDHVGAVKARFRLPANKEVFVVPR